MNPNEFAFLALGLVLGIASGAAIIVVLGSRPPTHEIRLTVTRDAIPRRSLTLAADVLAGALEGPAPGGPGDRRTADRDGTPDRTIVRSPMKAPTLRLPSPAAPMPDATAASVSVTTVATAIRIEPEPDPLLADLASADDPPSLQLVLDGDHRAMLRLVDAVAGVDGEARRAWEALLTGFVEAVRERAVDLGLVDLPMGNRFWDAFTIDECREIVVALAATGRRFDGRDGWADGVAPTYHDLSRALAACGIDPRRIRSWPNSAEIGELFRGARVAAGEAVARFAPTLDPGDVQDLLADRASGLEPLWTVWDVLRGAVVVEARADSADPLS